MATRLQATKHALNHFFFVYLILQVAGIWFPVQNFFRSLWWKAWGHNPDDDIGFHLGKVHFDDEAINEMIVSSNVLQLVEVLYGKGNYNDSVAFRQLQAYRQFKYLPYDTWKKIDDIWGFTKPGQYIWNWVVETDCLSTGRIAYLLSAYPEFMKFHEELLNIELKSSKPAKEA